MKLIRLTKLIRLIELTVPDRSSKLSSDNEESHDLFQRGSGGV